MPTALLLPPRLCVTRPSWAGTTPKVAPNLRAYRQPRSLPNIAEHDEMAKAGDPGAIAWPLLAPHPSASFAAPARPPLRRGSPLPTPWPSVSSLEEQCLASLVELKAAIEQDWPEVDLDLPEVVDTLQAITQLQMWCRYHGGEAPVFADVELAMVRIAGWQWARGRDWLRQQHEALAGLLTATLEDGVGPPVAGWVARLALERVDGLLCGERAPRALADDDSPLLDAVERELLAVVARAGAPGPGAAHSAQPGPCALEQFFADARARTSFSRLTRLVGDIATQEPAVL